MLDIARRRFLAEGYQAVTMRSIATEAGVDAALVSYFFGSKRGLFGAALALTANPPELLLAALPGDPVSLPERVLAGLVAAWDDPRQGGPLRVLVTAAVQEPGVARLLTDAFEHEMVERVADHIGGPHARHRAGAFVAQLAGLVFTRYVLRLEPLASMTADEIVRHVAPGLRAALQGPRPVPQPART